MVKRKENMTIMSADMDIEQMEIKYIAGGNKMAQPFRKTVLQFLIKLIIY